MVLPQIRQFRTSLVPSSKPMVNPDLLYKLGNKGALLEEKSIGVLGLSAYDLKRLEEAGICSLKHLAVWYDSDILTIPHFGIKKVRRLKAELESYLSAMLTEQTREFDPQPESQEISTTDLDELDPMAIHSSANFYLDSELEAFSKSLDKLKKRLISLELRLAKARIKTRKRTLDRTEFV